MLLFSSGYIDKAVLWVAKCRAKPSESSLFDYDCQNIMFMANFVELIITDSVMELDVNDSP